MPNDEFTVSVQYLRLIAEQVQARGIAVSGWLARSGLRPSQLGDASLTVGLETFRVLVTDALVMTKEPALGLIVGGRLLASTHGILGYALVNSATLRQAVEVLERFIALRIAVVAVSHERVRGELRVRFRPTVALGEIERSVMDAVLLTTKNVYDAITTGARVGRVSFELETPSYASLARDLFKAEVRWSQAWTGFSLPLELLDRPLAMSDPTAFEEAARICQRELDSLARDASMAVRVRRVLLTSHNGFPALPTTARLLHLTARTLHRRLVDEGTSFKQVLEDVRHTLAVEHLKAGRQSLQEIAYALGYTEMANFRRAFKRWESVAPSEYRRRHVETRPKAAKKG
jgi:AraC-like DNA-binding protein